MYAMYWNESKDNTYIFNISSVLSKLADFWKFIFALEKHISLLKLLK